MEYLDLREDLHPMSETIGQMQEPRDKLNKLLECVRNWWWPRNHLWEWWVITNKGLRSLF